MDDPRNSVKVNTLPYGRESVIGRSILFYASERKGVRRFRKVNERIIEDEENFFDLLFPFEQPFGSFSKICYEKKRKGK